MLVKKKDPVRPDADCRTLKKIWLETEFLKKSQFRPDNAAGSELRYIPT